MSYCKREAVQTGQAGMGKTRCEYIPARLTTAIHGFRQSCPCLPDLFTDYHDARYFDFSDISANLGILSVLGVSKNTQDGIFRGYLLRQ